MVGPVPIVLDHGDGALVSHVVELFDVVQFAKDNEGMAAIYARAARQVALRRGIEARLFLTRFCIRSNGLA